MGTIGGQQVPFLVDTGSCITLVDKMFLKGVSNAQITEGAFKSARAAYGKTMPLYGVVKLTFQLADTNIPYTAYVADLPYEVFDRGRRPLSVIVFICFALFI